MVPFIQESIIPRVLTLPVITMLKLTQSTNEKMAHVVMLFPSQMFPIPMPTCGYIIAIQYYVKSLDVQTPINSNPMIQPKQTNNKLNCWKQFAWRQGALKNLGKIWKNTGKLTRVSETVAKSRRKEFHVTEIPAKPGKAGFRLITLAHRHLDRIRFTISRRSVISIIMMILDNYHTLSIYFQKIFDNQ